MKRISFQPEFPRLLKVVQNGSINFALFIILTVLFSCGTVHKTQNLSGNEIDLKRKLRGGEGHSYTVQVNAGDLLHLQIIQQGIDVIAKVYSPDKKFTEQFDSPTGELDAENIYLLSDSTRNYAIEIIPAQKYADRGDYFLKIIRNEKPSEKDKKWMAALAATQKADKLRAKPETRQQSIDQYKSAAAEWMVLNDTFQLANAMRSLGFVYIRQKNYEEAVHTFNKLLPLWRTLGDTRAEGFTHLIIGRIYDLQKDYKTSLQYNLSSLEYWIKANDADQETFVLMNIGNLYAHLSDKQKAIGYFEDALKKNQSSKRPSIKAVILRDYATAMLSVGEIDKGLQLYNQSIKQWQSTTNKPEEARTAMLIASFYDGKGKKEDAILYYKNAYKIWKKAGEQTEMKAMQAALDKLKK